MPHPSFPIAVIALSFGAGILLSEADIQPSFLIFLASLALFTISHLKRWYRFFLVAAVGCFLFLGTMRYRPPVINATSHAKDHTIEIKKVQNTSAYRHQYVVKTTQNESVLLQTSLEHTFRIGDRFLVHGILEPLAAPKNPTDFDYKTFMRRKGVSYKMTLTDEIFIPLEHQWSLKSWAFVVQQRLIGELRKTSLHEDSKALIMALVLGTKKELSEERIQQYQRAGAMHLLAISGLHIGIILLLLRFLVAPLKRMKYGTILTAVIPIVLLWCFALITGAAPSVIRAVTMFSFLQIGLALKRKNVRMQGVWVSFMVLLFVQPRLLFDVGFQLSYAAVFGIVWMMPYWQRLFINQHRYMQYIAALIGIGGIAQLSVLPFSLYYFHQFPLLFWVSNLALVPFIGIIIFLGIASIAMSFIRPVHWFYTAIDAVFWCYQSVVAWIAKWEGFFVEHIPFRTTDALILGAVVLCLFCFLESPKKRKLVVLGIFSLGFHAQLYFDWKNPPKATIAQVYKNSLILTADAKKLIAISAKQTPQVIRMAQDFKQYYRLSSIEYTSIENTYKKLLVVDCLGVYRGIGKYEFVLLRQSPKIHLEELIDSLTPQIIIADGSNFPSFVERWKKTCAAKGIKFHATAVQGAYPLN